MKIFVIGFNKCGTLSIHNFFKKNNYKSIHWSAGRIEKKVRKNLKNNLPILNSYDNYQVFSDSYFLVTNFEDLHKEYPDAFFILNTRNMQKWICSRLNHMDGKYEYIEHFARTYKVNLSGDDMIKYWEKEWINHHQKVREYFKDNTNFFEFNIEKQTFKDLIAFFETHNVHLNLIEIHTNKTKNNKKKWTFKNGKYIFDD